MKLYFKDKDITLYEGKMQEVLDTLPDNSVDSIVCDPPYDLTTMTARFGKENSAPCKEGTDGSFARLTKGFMGKTWDGTGVAFSPETWQKCFRVLKSGGYLLAFGGTRTYHRMACAIEDAGFEIRDCLMWLYGCYSSDTQVLTDKGWKYFYELDQTEKILQWDKDKDVLSWVKPLNYFEYDINDEMVLLENNNTSQMVTKNHRVVCKIAKNHKQYSSDYNFINAQDILKSDKITLPLASYYYGNLNYEYAYMIGWWLTDAWIHTDKKACMFTQCKKDKLLCLKNELDRLKELGKCTYSEYIKKAKKENHNDEHVFYVKGELADYLLTNFPDREFKNEFIELNKESKDLLLKGLIDGDGSIRDNSYCITFWSKKSFRNDILSALLTTMGYRNHIISSEKYYGVVFNINHKTTELQYKHKKPNVEYNGKVYCLETETGAFVVRRNGKPFISGNSGFPKSHNVGLDIDKMNGYEDRGHRIAVANRNHPDGTLEPNGENLPKYEGITPDGKKWAGFGTALKPAYEPIIMARKPIEGTVAQNCLNYGVGALNIDECRVEYEKTQNPATNPLYRQQNTDKYKQIVGGEKSNGAVEWTSGKNGVNELGRFPANVITDGSDEVSQGFPNTKSSYNPNSKHENEIHRENAEILKYGYKERIDSSSYNDEGSAMRYFYSAKASKKDRDEGLECFEEKQVYANKEWGYGNNNGDNFGDRIANVKRANSHPTVKPTTLMQYLVRLVSPKGSTILDPFMGSGSTGKAVMFENRERNAGYKFIGVEMTDEYLPIAQARILYARDNYVYDIPPIAVATEKGKQTVKTNLFNFDGEDEE